MGYGIIVYTHSCSELCFCRYKIVFFLRAVMQKALVHTRVVIPGSCCAWEMDVSRQVKQRRRKAKEKRPFQLGAFCRSKGLQALQKRTHTGGRREVR